jgi:hypothetical protein
MSKDRTQKYATEMDFHEFVTWATGAIIFGIAEGQKLKDIVFMIVNQAASNEVFGGKRDAKSTKTG